MQNIYDNNTKTKETMTALRGLQNKLVFEKDLEE